MSEVKIYTVVSDELSPPVIGESFCTDMVRHSDYAELEQKLTDMAVQLANAESKCRELAAENAALKSFGDKLDEMHNDLNGEGTGIQGRAEVACQQAALEAAMEELDAIKTTATDAFLAEVRASGVDELNDTLCKLLPGCRYMDPPDGGSVTPLEQASRMVADYREQIQAAEKLIAELNEFVQHVKKCLVKNDEYAPLSPEVIDTILGINAAGITVKGDSE